MKHSCKISGIPLVEKGRSVRTLLEPVPLNPDSWMFSQGFVVVMKKAQRDINRTNWPRNGSVYRAWFSDSENHKSHNMLDCGPGNTVKEESSRSEFLCPVSKEKNIVNWRVMLL